MTEMEQTIWVAHSLFERGKTAGSTANISFRDGERIYISGSGTCFGTLKEEDFAVIDLSGNPLSGKKPSKEYPLHLELYRKSDAIRGVVHTHSFYATLLSCLSGLPEKDCIPTYTPYLQMKLGAVDLVEYHKPGSPQLFAAFAKAVGAANGYLLKNHGPIVGGKDIMDAFYCIEELEESAKIAWFLRNEQADRIGGGQTK